MAFTLSNVRLDGCQFGPASKKDYRAAFPAANVPDRVDLRQHCTDVEQQGQIGSCTANAVVGAVEYHYKRRDGQSPDLSRMFVYYNTRQMKGAVPFDCGAQIREAMASLLAFGACREEIWPYNPMLFAVRPPQQAYDEAVSHEAVQYARVDGVQGAIAALAQELPVVFGASIPERLFIAAERTGVMPDLTPEERNRQMMGGHSMLLVGYENRERRFIVRNSWGEAWGDRGYCYIPYDVMECCAGPDEYWVIAELEKRQGMRLVRPGRGNVIEVQGDWELVDDLGQPRTGRAGDAATTAAKVREDIKSRLDADLAASKKKIDDLLKRR